MTEVEEVVDTVAGSGAAGPLDAILTLEDAAAAITASLGPPEEIGWTIHQNATWALLGQARRHRGDA